MLKVFRSLAIANLLLFALSAVSAIASAPSASQRHVLLGVITLFLSCFNQVLVFTYFTVTGKVIIQAVHLARLDPAILPRVKEHKRCCTHGLAIIVATVVLVSATGGAVWRSAEMLVYHLPAVILAAVLHGWVFLRENHIIRQNAAFLRTTLEVYSIGREQPQ